MWFYSHSRTQNKVCLYVSKTGHLYHERVVFWRGDQFAATYYTTYTYMHISGYIPFALSCIYAYNVYIYTSIHIYLYSYINVYTVRPLMYICGTHWNTLEHTTTHCNKLQHVLHVQVSNGTGQEDLFAATHCNILQHTAKHCNKLQNTAIHCNTFYTISLVTALVNRTYSMQHIAMYCKTLQDTATTHCNTLQHSATHFTPSA